LFPHEDQKKVKKNTGITLLVGTFVPYNVGNTKTQDQDTHTNK